MKLPTDFEVSFAAFLQETMHADLAHDLSHVLRVVSNAKQLTLQENADLWIVLPAAYLHDCFSYPKNHSQSHQSSQLAGDKAIQFLASIQYPSHTYKAIYHAIAAHSYSANITPTSIEAKIVQDADRLDALGAIGIARCIQVGSSFDAQLYSLDDPFADKRLLDDHKYTVDHFFNKLFKLPESMQTKAGKKEAHKRMIFMRQYLNQLRQEII
ncbi:phosphohydrolase [Vibrio sp. UCD-FRSSP16_10]|uniref:HD domain-containing protein n=1 Tax=unclassified Vibrio TaxID=2614977 RepID=UPI0007FE29A3|nr:MULTISPECIES: HD domain-containing protein [unclassified Vibrio]OBT16948.1 phosphohydrolase [Vibrio sp. UCD-FRSSP16_30]OBT21939.1 phosphohydrolase [Vibrio sp. UCD-FRSSP16_10]